MDYEYIGEKRVCIRKERRCWGCNRRYPKGSLMNDITTKDNKIDHTYWCEVCDDFLKTLTYDEGFSLGDMWEYPNYKSFRENHPTQNKVIA